MSTWSQSLVAGELQTPVASLNTPTQRQVFVQPSPEPPLPVKPAFGCVVVPSSHSSYASRTPLPQIVLVAPGRPATVFAAHALTVFSKPTLPEAQSISSLKSSQNCGSS